MARRLIEGVRISLYWSDKHTSVTHSPERPIKVNLKSKIGWRIMLIGMWIMFGHSKEFRTKLDSLWED